MTTMRVPAGAPVARLGGCASPMGTISTALLLPQERLAREPLGAWADRLAAALQRCRAETRTARDLGGGVSAIANNAALMALHGGDPATAWRLCQGQLRWLSRLGRRARDREVPLACVPPWVNLGRLESLGGSWQAALDRFACLVLPRADDTILLGTTRLHLARGSGAPEPAVRFATGLRTTYVIDSLRALLVNGRFAEAAAFAAEEHSGHWMWRQEATAVAACRTGDIDRARSTLDDALREARGWHRVVFRLRLGEVFACAGDPERAVGALLPVAATVGQVSPEAKGQLQSLYVLLRLAQACQEVGLEAEAATLGRDVYQGGCASGDEVFRIEGLRILAAAVPARERSRWQDRLSELEGTTGYRKYRRGGEPVRSGPLERLCGELLELFQAGAAALA